MSTDQRIEMQEADSVKSNGTIRTKALRAGQWSLAIRVGSQVVALLRVAILARLLPPSEFGTMGLALILLAGLDAFSTLGFEMAIIHRQDGDRYLDTAWSLGFLRSLLIAGTLIAAAPFVAVWFGSPGLVPVLQIIAVSEIVRALGNPGMVLLRKDLDFPKIFVHQFSGSFIDFLVSIVFAVTFRSAVALALGLLASQLLRWLLSYLLQPHRPRWRFDKAQIGPLLRYGRWVFAANIVIFLAGNLEGPILGKMLSISALGYYVMSLRLASEPLDQFRHAVRDVALPTLSNLQDRPDSLRRAFLTVHELLSGLTIVIAGAFFCMAPSLVPLVFGDGWESAIPVVRILSVFAAFRGVVSLGGPLFLAIGRPKLDFQMNLLRLIVLAVVVVPLVHRFGEMGAAAAISIAMATLLVPWSVYCRRELQVSVLDLLASPLRMAIVAGAAGLVVTLFQANYEGTSLALRPLRLLFEGGIYLSCSGLMVFLVVHLTRWDLTPARAWIRDTIQLVSRWRTS